MPETIADKTIFTLSEVGRSIQKTLAERYRSQYWIKAEMNKLNYYSHSGHCYPELLEKKEGKVIAEMRATLWKGDYQRINQRFLTVTKEPLKNGINVLLQAFIMYDPIHGLSLHITDIDPSFSLGELEREKQQSISTLKSQGLFNTNKQLPFPLLPKRIAIISVETSKGLADFLKIIDGNPYGYRFEHQLFPALLQGDKSVASINAQLARISQNVKQFDVVAIIRGGGGEIGLSSYNNLSLATCIATFPLPVITGIGHATNETVSEMVAYKNAITPSELADFLIQHFHNFAHPVARAKQLLQDKSRQILTTQEERLATAVKYFRLGSQNLLKEQSHYIHRQSTQLTHRGRYRLMQETGMLKQSEQNLSRQAKHHLFQATDQISYLAGHLLRDNQYLTRLFRQSLEQVHKRLALEVKGHLKGRQTQLHHLDGRFLMESKKCLQQHQQQLYLQERQLDLLNPHHVLKRGYSITLHSGKALTDPHQIKIGEKIKTILAFGELESAITFVKPENEQE